MQLSSFLFIAFLAAVTIIEAVLQLLKNNTGKSIFGTAQLIALLTASYGFIYLTDPKSCIIILVYSVATYLFGIMLEKHPGNKTDLLPVK